MPLSLPPTTKSLGNSVIIVLTTPPASATAPTKAELNAGKFITCHLWGEDTLFTPSQGTVDGPRKRCSKVVPKELGTTTYDVTDLQYSYVPQKTTTPGAAGNEAFEALDEGAIVYLVEGDGLDGKTSALATADVISFGQVECGVQRRGRTGDGEADDFSVMQSFVLVDGASPVFDYAVPAT